MNLDFSKITFKTNWASATTIIVLLVGIITLYLNNNSIRSKIDTLENTNTTLNNTITTLSETVSILKGNQDITNKAIGIFMENPTGELVYRLERIEKTIEEKFGVTDTETKPTFTNRLPNH